MSLFIVLDLAFLFLALGQQYEGHAVAAHFGKAGGSFGLAAAILAWYNMFAGMADSSNFFMAIPVIHLPWSDTVKKARQA